MHNNYPNKWDEIKKNQFERADYRCELCNSKVGDKHPRYKKEKPVKYLVVHHCKYLGKDNERNNKYPNLIVLCDKCHFRIHLDYYIQKRDKK